MAWLAFPTGLIPDPFDQRDLALTDRRVAKRVQTDKLTDVLEAAPAEETRIDLVRYFPPVDNQVPLNSCTASAAAGLLGYFERKAFGNDVIPSRMFLYKVERNLLGQTGDRGAFLRVAMKALRAFGVPPEKYWPFDPRLLDVEPTAFEYAFAANYKATTYFRIDQPGMTGDALLAEVRSRLAQSFPSMFGVELFPSFEQAGNGRIPLPFAWERPALLHALVAAGYDDSIEISATDPFTGAKQTTRGAIRVRNSWGTVWGDGGYGWLPYDYIRRGHTSDWWSLTKAEYLDTNEFGPGTATRNR